MVQNCVGNARSKIFWIRALTLELITWFLIQNPDELTFIPVWIINETDVNKTHSVYIWIPQSKAYWASLVKHMWSLLTATSPRAKQMHWVFLLLNQSTKLKQSNLSYSCPIARCFIYQLQYWYICYHTRDIYE